MADTATFGAAMKTKLIGPIRDNLHNGKVLLFGSNASGSETNLANPTDFKGIIARAEGIDFVGNEFRIPIKTDRNQSVGFRSENEYLPAPGSSSYSYLSEPMRYAYALFNITGQLLRASESQEGAFKEAFKTEMEDTLLTSKLDHNRAAYNDGSGALCAVATGGAAGISQITADTTINFRGGEVIDFCSAAGATVSAGHTVTGVNRTTKVVTFSPVTTGTVTAGTHYPVRSSSDSTTAVPNNSNLKEILGLKSIVNSSGTLHGLNPTTYPWWKSYVDSAGGSLTDRKLRDAKDGTMFESGVDLEAGLDFVYLTTRGIRSRYADTLVALKKFNDAQSTTLHGGFTALDFDGNPIFVDDQCQVGTLYGLAVNRLFWAEASDWDWMDKDGQVLKWESRRDRYIAVLYKYTQFGTTHRNAHFKLTGLTDDSR